MIRTILIILIFAFIFSCNSNGSKEVKVNNSNRDIEIRVESVKKIENRLGRKISIQEYILSQDNEDFYERVSTLPIFGRTKDGKMFTGLVMWFKHYYDENISSKGTFHDFLEDVMNNQQDIEVIEKVVTENYMFSKSPEVFQHVENPISKIISQFTYKKEPGDQFYIKKKFLESFGVKYSIAYLFYKNGYVLIEDGYEPSSFFLPINKLY